MLILLQPQVVSKESAKIPGYLSQSITAAHANMCKFQDKDDSNYRKVLEVLQRWAQELKSPNDSQTVEEVCRTLNHVRAKIDTITRDRRTSRIRNFREREIEGSRSDKSLAVPHRTLEPS